MQEIDQTYIDAQRGCVESDEAVQNRDDAPNELDGLIVTIVSAARSYQQLMRAEKPLENQVGAYFRTMEKVLKERKLKTDIVDERKKKFKKVVSGWKRAIPTSDEIAVAAMENDLDPVLLAIDAHRASLQVFRAKQAKILETAALYLPVWPWVCNIPGIGARNLALVVGNAGAPLWPNYANPAKLWKRFGLAVMEDGKAQRKFKDKKKALEAGFSPARRAVMHVVGDALVMGNKNADGSPGKYWQLYLDRKEYEAAKNPDAIPMQHHKRALRYMEKRFLRDLWEEWKRASRPAFD